MGSIGGVISSLTSLAAKLLPGSSSSSTSDEGPVIEKELNKLMRTLERIKATLHDAEEREIRDRSVKLWLKELKEVAYAAEDVLDEYQYQVLRAEVESRGDSAESSRKRKKLELPDDLADRIKTTIGQFDEIAKDRIALQLREEDGPRHCKDEMCFTPTSHMVVESNIFGRENEKEELINLLCSNNNNNNGDVVSVVTIVGMGGLGKTTVAQLVYNDSRIRQKFDQLGWVCVSEDFSVGRLTKEVVGSITKESCDKNNLSVLQEKLRKELEGKSFFLVLDDVWNEKRSVWELFQIPFLSAKLVKILVTTRNEPVARIMQTNCHEGWKLEIGKQIMKKCGRLPLAVKSIASLLRHEESEESWREILANELWELEVTKEIFPSLQISYSRLPSYLKPCLMYCSMFPKDYSFYINELIPLWYAQGYIESKEKRNIYEIGMKYAKQLFERSFFEGNWSTENRELFRLHDMIHDLVRSNSGNECYSIEHGKTPIFSKQIFHVYVNDLHELVNVKPFPSGYFTSLRTLITGRNVTTFATISDISEIPALRAVEFRSQCYKFEFLNSIGHLKHLRYILLRGIFFEKLPESICYLYNLRALNVIYSAVVELPEHIGNLISLEELKLIGSRIVLPASFCQLKSLRILEIRSRNLEELPHEIETLTNLQSLYVSWVSSAPAGLNKLIGIQNLHLEFHVTMSNNCDEFGCLNNMVNLKGTLFIRGLQNITTNLVDSKHINLMNMHMLESLMLAWTTDVNIGFHYEKCSHIDLKIKTGGNGESHGHQTCLCLLERLRPHRNLKELYIFSYYGLTFPKWIGDPFACASLEKVYLKRCKNIVFLPFSNLQNLKDLQIEECRSLKFIQATPQLQMLSISGCERLIYLPGIQKLKSLVELKIYNCPNLKSLLKLPDPSLELTTYTYDSFYRMLSMGLTNLTSLSSLVIVNCPKLGVIEDELRPIESCKVNVSYCPNLREWCLQHNFSYKDTRESDSKLSKYIERVCAWRSR
ncbi:hypothetical protein LUZ60_015084 [Juncus effusus]|nr:hypothetical protein LUZ60_015084 [Juncus effusus]